MVLEILECVDLTKVAQDFARKQIEHKSREDQQRQAKQHQVYVVNNEVAALSYEAQVARKRAELKTRLELEYLKVFGPSQADVPVGSFQASTSPHDDLATADAVILPDDVTDTPAIRHNASASTDVETHCPGTTTLDEDNFDQVLALDPLDISQELLDIWDPIDMDGGMDEYDRALCIDPLSINQELLDVWDPIDSHKDGDRPGRKTRSNTVFATKERRLDDPLPVKTKSRSPTTVKPKTKPRTGNNIKPRALNKSKHGSGNKDFFDLSDRVTDRLDKSRFTHRQKQKCPVYLCCPICTGRPCSSTTRCLSDF
ncbi:hypothetical protein BGZ83_001263 [Gryganskiella cystojenkinii]|nr:hypothetical protein BGZ83_001263 [Gryganskiella cystojenkinii]